MIHRFLTWAATPMEVSLVEMGNPWKKGTLRAGTGCEFSHSDAQGHK